MAECEGGERSVLGGLENKRTTSSDGRRCLPCQHCNREIPLQTHDTSQCANELRNPQTEKKRASQRTCGNLLLHDNLGKPVPER